MELLLWLPWILVFSLTCLLLVLRRSLLVTCWELLNSIPPKYIEGSADSGSSSWPGADRPQVRSGFDPCPEVRTYMKQFRRWEWCRYRPMAFRSANPCGSEESTNAEINRTVIDCVNQLLEHDDILDLRNCRIYSLPVHLQRQLRLDESKRLPAFTVVRLASNSRSDGLKDVISAFEGKRPEVAGFWRRGTLPDTLEQYDADLDFCSALLQELDYMHMYHVPWGLVACLAYYVVLYEDPRSGELKISQALPYDQPSPTIVMVMYYIIRQSFLALHSRPSVDSPALSTDPSNAPIDVSTPLLGRRSPPNPTELLTKRRTSLRIKEQIAQSTKGGSQATGHLGTSPTRTLETVSWESLRLQGADIGWGRSGTVYKASFQGRLAAVKTVDPDDEEFEEKVLELRNEHGIYLRLTPLWGTTALPYDQSSPTIVMVIYYIIRQNFLALQSRPSVDPPALSTDRTNAPTDVTTPLLGRRSRPLSPTSNASLTKRRTSTRLRDRTSLRLGADIGWGRSGTVYKASFQGRLAAVKTVDPDDDELRNEHGIYLRLTPLWGTTVPELLAFGFCPNLGTWVLITEFLEGDHPARGTMSVRQKLEAVKSLKSIHRLGVRHNDVKLENMVVVGSKVFFLDFGFSTLNENEEERKTELNYLKSRLMPL
ncbi:hypothetical protein KFL_001090280 [Klebsormidium nitens]|uniref:Protein kinase domain-containing protein n=1 Tax=Klebsormidium nitens TaxID=105231 RepID=A0A1Y1HUS4_KLENI|nr:hypothetical protein KFL_001090280 [Klebsormidium nitens]|eukprot:GAQ82380.1 hypothetical protein KFL_001090280 [Klebsormidium nitens]